MPPLLITACALSGFACLLGCIYAARRRYQLQKAAMWVHTEARSPRIVAVSRPNPHSIVPVKVRALRAPPPVPEWRLTDVAEEDIDMDDMPPITAIHYGLSPNDQLEGGRFDSVADDDDDPDDTNADELELKH